jgi:hypothetical protein
MTEKILAAIDAKLIVAILSLILSVFAIWLPFETRRRQRHAQLAQDKNDVEKIYEAINGLLNNGRTFIETTQIEAETSILSDRIKQLCLAQPTSYPKARNIRRNTKTLESWTLG